MEPSRPSVELGLDALWRASQIQEAADQVFGPPAEGTKPKSELVLLRSLCKGTRGYIESTVDQINGCYEKGWYDACAVMIRRLLETLIVEAFEHHKAGQLIQDSNGNYKPLSDLVGAALTCTKWTLGRSTKKSLAHLKQVGDMSAHSRRYIAHRGDIEKWIPDLRIAVQEFVYIASLK